MYMYVCFCTYNVHTESVKDLFMFALTMTCFAFKKRIGTMILIMGSICVHAYIT